MQKISEKLEKILKDNGAVLVGFGDMREIETCSYPSGIWVAIPIPIHIMEEIQDGPTKAYGEMYHIMNKKLDEIVIKGAEFLKEKGYQAYAQTTSVVERGKEDRTRIPHKTVATRAGMGWIGKSCLLITPEYGSGIRMSTILTDAPLICNKPINESKCGACSRCVDACPAQALKGTLWNTCVDRDEIVNHEMCAKKAKEQMVKNAGIEMDICGKCFVVCPYTRKYMKK